MKKVLSIFVIIATVGVVVAGCSGGGEDASKAPEKKAATDTKTPDTK